MKYTIKQMRKKIKELDTNTWVETKSVLRLLDKLEKELQEKLRHPIHGYMREDTMISVKEILGYKVNQK